MYNQTIAEPAPAKGANPCKKCGCVPEMEAESRVSSIPDDIDSWLKDAESYEGAWITAPSLAVIIGCKKDCLRHGVETGWPEDSALRLKTLKIASDALVKWWNEKNP